MRLTAPAKANQDKRDKEILFLYTKGISLQEIATKYGLSRERIRQIIENISNA